MVKRIGSETPKPPPVAEPDEQASPPLVVLTPVTDVNKGVLRQLWTRVRELNEKALAHWDEAGYFRDDTPCPLGDTWSHEVWLVYQGEGWKQAAGWVALHYDRWNLRATMDTYLLPAFRRRGIGAATLLRMVETARGRGMATLRAWVDYDNHPALTIADQHMDHVGVMHRSKRRGQAFVDQVWFEVVL